MAVFQQFWDVLTVSAHFEPHLVSSSKSGSPEGAPAPLAACLPAAGPLLHVLVAFCAPQCLCEPRLGSGLHICKLHLPVGPLAYLPAGMRTSELHLGAGPRALQLPQAYLMPHQHCSHEPCFYSVGPMLASSQRSATSQLGLSLPPATYHCPNGPTILPTALPILGNSPSEPY